MFDVHGAGIVVRSSDSRALAAVEEMLSPFDAELAQPAVIELEVTSSLRRPRGLSDARQLCDLGGFRVSGAGSRRFVEVNGVGYGEVDLDSRRGTVWTDGWRPGYAWGMTRLLVLPLWTMLLKTTGRFALHSAGLANNGKALLFPAASGSGKSVLTLRLAQAGYELLGDDTQFLMWDDATLRVGGYPEKIALRESARALFPEFSGIATGPFGRIVIELESLPGGLAQAPVAPGVIAFPQFTGEAESRFRLIDRGQALRRLILCSFFLIDGTALPQQMNALTALISGSVCAELDVGTDREKLALTVRELEEST